MTAIHKSAALLAMLLAGLFPLLSAADDGWQAYTNPRFGFSVRYPPDWRPGNPMPDGIGITLYPPVEQSQVAVSGFMNVMEGKSQDGRQTLEEFAAAHRRIITELYEKKHMQLAWQKDRETTLAGFPAKRLAFTYQNDRGEAMQEIHVFSVGRNEGRGVRIKLPATAQKELMPIITRVVESFEPGRDQNAVSPLVPK
jgi:hypothetical protein